MTTGRMFRMSGRTAAFLVGAIASTAGATGDFYMSWSENEYVQTLTVRADTTATCYLLVQDYGVEFVGYEFWMILSDDLEVVAHQPALLHAVGSITSPEELTGSPVYVWLGYLDCEYLTGLTCVATIDVAINASAVQDNPGTSGLVPFEFTSPPSIVVSLIPDNCLEISADDPFDSWNAAIVIADKVPVDVSTWSSVKALFSAGK